MAGSKKPNDKAAKASDKGTKSKGSSSSKEDKSGDASGSGKLKPAASINCEKHSKKEDALTKLRDGAKFDDVAREFSEDKARQGGSLGWKIRGALDATFEKAAYDLEPSTTANPKYVEVKTGYGYHIVMVEGRK
ncbi:Peptidyl-prolyl cis-trans isomerase pin4 [Xylographa carneopallida]|nr:Peptidyl-prolyl cis-trans isomerase pin4 [Xylographa carneopallida]